MRFFVACSALLVLAGAAIAGTTTANSAKVKTGFVTVAFGKVTRPDGTVIDIKGLRLPYRLEPIDVEVLKKGAKKKPPMQATEFRWPWEKRSGPRAQGPEAMQTLYWMDHQANGVPGDYGVVDPSFPSCSTVDDITPTPGSVGKPWKYMTWGLSATMGDDFLCRFISYTSYTTGRAPGLSAFDPYPVPTTYQFDFGFNWNNWPLEGAAKVTVDVSAASVWAPTNQFWFAQQYRDTYVFGNPDSLAFKYEVYPVFSPFGGPQVGQSDIFFWLDGGSSGGPLDGAVEDEDLDAFGDEQNPSGGNYLLKLEALTNSQTQDSGPWDAVTTIGTRVSGNLGSLLFQDTNYYVIAPFYAGARTSPHTQLTMTGTSPTDLLQSLSVFGQIKADQASTYRLEMYRYRTSPSGAPGWVTVQTGPVGNTDTPFYYAWTAGNLEQWVDPSTFDVQMRVSCFTPGTAARSWRFRINKVNWTFSW